jgi:two-component system, NtrC family, nitrogen regulation sensor histidine kinase NtrY
VLKLGSYGPLLVAVLLAWDAASGARGWVLVSLAAGVLVLSARSASRWALVLAGSLIAVAAGARLHLHLQGRATAEQGLARVRQSLEGLTERKDGIVALVNGAAEHVARLPEAVPALRGDREALARLFLSLERYRDTTQERPALALLDPTSRMVAWSGRLGDLSLAPDRAAAPAVFVVEGGVSTTLVASVPLRQEGGQPAGWAVAVLPVAVRRNVRNEFLRDFDLLTGGDPRTEIRYVDYRRGPAAVDRFPPLDPALMGQEARLLAPDSSVLALVRVAATGAPEVQKALFARYQRLLALLAVITVIVWAAAAPGSAGTRWALGAVALRAVLALLGPPVPGPDSPLLSPDLYASSLRGLGPLLQSPLDLLLTMLTLAVLSGVLAWPVLRGPGRPFSAGRAALAWLGALVVLRAFAHLLADTVTNCSLDLTPLTLVPHTVSHFVLHLSLLLLAGATVLSVAALHAWAGAPERAGARAVWIAGAALSLAALAPSWPGLRLTVPPVLAGVFLLLAALAGASWPRLRPRWEAAGPEARSGLALAGTMLLAGFLHAWLFHAGERETRRQMEQEHAEDVRRQPQWRRHVLAQTQPRVDRWRLLEETPAGPRPPGIEELAFAVWSDTDLAGFGFSSAVEVQDAEGHVVSRFALNLPSLSSEGPLPGNEFWRVTEEPMTVASAEHQVLHARRLLVYEGQVKGAVHVYLADDYWNLPFLRGRDPYSVLFRSASLGTAPARPVALVAYHPDGRLAFSSEERPPARPTPPPSGGRWMLLAIDGQPRHAYVFADQGHVYLLAYPRTSPGRYAADLVEAMAAFALLALLALLAVMVVRTALRRQRLSLPSLQRAVAQRFAVRLFVVLAVLAFVPVAVLETVVRRFVADRLRQEAEEQALERAAVARKAVEDYVFFQSAEGRAARQPVTDAALVWVSSVVRNDLDVFEDGELVASSKRELYDSSLLAPRVSGAVYRALLLDGQPASLRPERIGAFVYLVASVPLRLGSGEPAILSLPLASRQRELEATVGDLDRTIRLASVVFFALAALLAQSLARRISDPIRQLIEATRRIAQGDLSTRVSATSQDELQRLVESFNQMAGDLDRQRHDLERSNRLAAWAEMARQVAHEVKNPLTPIQLSAEHLRRVWRDGGTDFAAVLEACTQTILRQVRTLRGMVTEFSAFARPPAPDLQTCDLSTLVEEAVGPYRLSLPPGVEAAVEVPGAPLPVKADRRLLERAVVNLFENALQAVGDGGRIAVRVRRMDGRAEVEISDSGPGIDPEVRNRIFEPFFSTKTDGSGLGLALVKKIVEDHGGGVCLESPPEGGTRARLWLPTPAPEPARPGVSP